jgi:hypothetical protein
MDCSATHAVPLSNALEVRIISAASPASGTLAPTKAGTLPAPTAIVGLPHEYAARTMPGPPVARTRAISGRSISSRVAASVGASRQETRPSGAPAATAASAITSAARREHLAARGCGACTMALPALTAARLLNSTVEVGLVTGMIPAITPIGLPTAVTRFASSTHSTPTARRSSIQLATNPVLYLFLMILSW